MIVTGPRYKFPSTGCFLDTVVAQPTSDTSFDLGVFILGHFIWVASNVLGAYMGKRWFAVYMGCGLLLPSFNWNGERTFLGMLHYIEWSILSLVRRGRHDTSVSHYLDFGGVSHVTTVGLCAPFDYLSLLCLWHRQDAWYLYINTFRSKAHVALNLTVFSTSMTFDRNLLGDL